MSADFWAGYISGAAGIIIGNPLDVLKVRLQAGAASPSPSSAHLPSPPTAPLTSSPASLRSSYIRPFLVGTAAPVLGYGALNALLFVSYNRTEAFLNTLSFTGGSPGDTTSTTRGTNLLTAWIAGAVGGLATWVVSTPTELVKCRAQVQSLTTTTTTTTPNPRTTPPSSSSSSWAITKHILTHRHGGGIRGLYAGGTVTALRDAIGYGFYFWGYELCSRGARQLLPAQQQDSSADAAARVLLCGGLAGIITWASIFPLDVVKTRVQTQGLVLVGGGGVGGEGLPLLGGGRGSNGGGKRLGAWEMAKETYRVGGVRPFFRGLGVCSVRAFIVNAVQWAVYEWIMLELGQGRKAGRDDVLAVEVGAG